MCREMKDSGVQWIGYIPKTWNITKIKMLSDIYTGTSISDDLKDRYTVKENAIPYISTKDLDVSSKSIDYDNGLFIPNGEKGFRLAEKDSTLLCIEGGSAGRKVAFTDRDVNFVNKLCCIKSKEYNNKFIYYYINSSSFTEQFNLNLSGLIGGVSINLLKQIITVVPTAYEQQKIANYLDKKVSQIDNIISKQKILIEKYKSYKQSLITETVTKGLNKNVPMKDSAIEWIGEIPSHWSKEKIKYLVQISRGRFNHRPRNDVRFYNGEYPFIQTGDVARANKYINTYEQTLNKKGFEVSKEFKKGTIVMTIAANIGDIAILNFDSCAPDSIVGFEPIGYSHWNYIYYLFIAAKPAFFETSIISTQLNLNIELIKELFVVRPPMEEQKQIAEFLDKKCIAIDSAISKKEELIEKLESYKKSLIYECVTGKRAVN